VKKPKVLLAALALVIAAASAAGPKAPAGPGPHGESQMLFKQHAGS
jgi:hypothetical protein